MEVEQRFATTTSKVAGINGDNLIILGTNNVAAETNEEATTITTTNMGKTDCDDKMDQEPGIALSRSASSHERRQQAKKRGAFGLFRAVFTSFSGGGSMKKKEAAMGDGRKKANDGDKTAPAAVVRSSSDVASWKNLVDGMRPLRLYGQLEYYPPPPPMGHDVYHDVLLPPPSPPDQRSQSQGMTSRYSSAQDLQELANGGHDNGEEEKTAPTTGTEDGGDDGGSPNAIDMQAEEFIAKFYEQFRLQKSESFNNRAE